MSSASDGFKLAQRKVDAFVRDVVSEELFSALGAAAHELYGQQFVKKENPYGEPWDYRKGDENRTKSYSRLGAPVDTDRESFSLVVASPRPNRSCVPFEPRGLGAWRPRFEEILMNRARLRFSSVRP